MNKRIKIILILIILSVGLLLRIPGISAFPPGFFCDEASIGYNAYTVLHTGKDEHGNSFPLFFKAFGEYKNPLDIYSAIPFIALFGLHEHSVRLVSIVYSLGATLVLFLFGKKLLGLTLGILTAITFTLAPWSIHISKTNMEGLSILVFFLSLIMYFQSKNNHPRKLMIMTAIFSGVATYAYFPGRIIMPLYMLIFGIYIALKTKKIFVPLPGLLLYCILCIPLVIHMLGPGLSRWNAVSLFNTIGVNPINKISTSYALHFSPDFLFYKGDIGMRGQYITRHSIRGIGEFYPWQLIFMAIGFIYVVLHLKVPALFSVFILTMFYPLPSSLTGNVSPQATRAIAGLVPLSILSAIGMWVVYRWFIQKIHIPKAVLIIFFVLLETISVIYYLNREHKYQEYAADYWGWQYGPKEIFAYFLTQKDTYDELFMTGMFNEPYIFYKFYDPDGKCSNCHIGGITQLNTDKKQLFAVRAHELNEIQNHYVFRTKKTIALPNNITEYYIGEITPKTD